MYSFYGVTCCTEFMMDFNFKAKKCFCFFLQYGCEFLHCNNTLGTNVLNCNKNNVNAKKKKKKVSASPLKKKSS